VIAPARGASFKALYQIKSHRVFSDDALNADSIGKMNKQDRHLTTEIVYGCLRWQALLDYVLAAVSSRSWNEVDPRARILLRMSLYQMWRMERIPDYALVNDAVEIAKRELGKGIDKFINGVLRKLTRARPWKEEKTGILRDAPPWILASLPQWLWERWAVRYGEAPAKEYALSLNKPPQVAFRFTEKCQVSDPDWIPSDLVPNAYIQENRRSDWEEQGAYPLPFQDEASQLIPHLLGPVHGWTIWDACAAPGGKSAILCANIGKSGHLVASDFSKTRTALLINTLGIVPGCRNSVLVANASEPPPFDIEFDAVLADVPCSGLGTLRRNPEIKWNFSPENFSILRQTQMRILKSVSKAVRPGGFLLYSTCSTEPEENELNVQSFLNDCPGFRRIKPIFPTSIENWTGTDHFVRTFPSFRLWDGFFAALLERTS
jgi:16S rRNA (cytosine967-C5)-methyltransferase